MPFTRKQLPSAYFLHKDPLEGIEVKIKIAKVVNSLKDEK